MNFKKIYLMLSVVAIGTFSACSPDEAGSGNGLTDTNVDASFTATAVDANHYTFTSSRPGVLGSKWDFGKTDDVIPAPGKESETVFFPDAGTYTITHVAIGRGGFMTTATQQITVATSDPNAGNLVRGGKFNSPEAIGEWTKLIISGSGADWTFANNKATVTASGYNQQGIYQAINVVGGKSYKIDMFASTAGVGNTWFEVYASKTAPSQNNDYSADGIRMQLNTWAGCGGSALNGWLSAVGCGGSGNTVTFADSGVMYLVIKSGGENNSGISITNVEVRGQ
ncbi:MAG: hypothetical protein PSV16_10600 [Flavobacterium sp.]|nr:hypothetical protein [Flavobacterium sp.]